MRDLVEISASEGNIEELVENIRSLSSIHNVELSVVDKEKAVGSVASNRTLRDIILRCCLATGENVGTTKNYLALNIYQDPIS